MPPTVTWLLQSYSINIEFENETGEVFEIEKFFLNNQAIPFLKA